MKLRHCALISWVLLVPAAAQANDFGVLRTAIPVEKSVWRLEGGGIFGLEADSREALLIGGSTGLAKEFDFEAKLAISGDDTSVGGGVNYLLMKAADRVVDLSVGAGLHYVSHDLADVTAFDLSFVGSKMVHPRVTMYGALALTFGSQDVPEGSDGSFTDAHLAAGVEYKINDKLNFLGELGFDLNDRTGHYIAGSIHYYFR